MVKQNGTGLKYWVEKLKTHNLPVLGNVIHELNRITGDNESDANQLAEVIMRDPTLTSHVLRVANSVNFNYSSTPISTVTRAIIQIGFKGMRAICISLLVVDSLLKGKEKERLLHLVAQGFHTATQARNLLKSTNHEDLEEVFVAGILYHVGELAFWASESLDENNQQLFDENPRVRREAMVSILGTSFKSISRQLAKHWSLGETLEKSLETQNTDSELVKAVVLGERISRSAIYGWESPQMQKVLQEVAQHENVPLQEALDKVKAGGDQAAQVAMDYGVADACPLIPTSAREVILERKSLNPKILKGDPYLQLNILRDLSNAQADNLDVNAVFQMVLEGMHRGIGLERVCIAFVRNHRATAKYVLGDGVEHWRRSFNFDVNPYADSVFAQLLLNGGTRWIDEQQIKQNRDLFSQQMSTIIGRFPCFIHAVEVDGRRAAIFYADRWNHGGTLTDNQYESFKHFCIQAEQCLTVLSSRTQSLKRVK